MTSVGPWSPPNPSPTTRNESGAGLKVLFVSGTHLFPPRSGGTLRSSALVNALRRHGLDVSVVALTASRKEYLARSVSSVHVWPSGTEEYVDRGLHSALTWFAGYVLGLPWVTLRLVAANVLPGELLLPSVLRRGGRAYDVIFVDGPYLYPIFSVASARGKLRIMGTHNVEHHLYDDRAGWTSRVMRALVRGIEVRAASGCDILVTCSADDARFFADNAPPRRTIVVPNGVEVNRFDDLAAERARTREQLGIADDVRVFLSTGSKWGPNTEAFESLVRFARANGPLLEQEKIHILVVGGVAAEPMRERGLTATGKVDRVEPFFAAADAALNPVSTGAGTNVKMSEFIAARLPILSTRFGTRGLVVEDGKTGFIFESDTLGAVLSRVRRLFDENPARLRQIAEEAFRQNEDVIDMNASVRQLVEQTRAQFAPGGATTTDADRGPEAP